VIGGFRLSCGRCHNGAFLPPPFGVCNPTIPPLHPPALRFQLGLCSCWIDRQALDECAARALLRALQHHCSRRTYQQVVADGGMRIDLQGEPVEAATAAKERQGRPA
jgi:sRNA-binding protein